MHHAQHAWNSKGPIADKCAINCVFLDGYAVASTPMVNHRGIPPKCDNLPVIVSYIVHLFNPCAVFLRKIKIHEPKRGPTIQEKLLH